MLGCLSLVHFNGLFNDFKAPRFRRLNILRTPKEMDVETSVSNPQDASGLVHAHSANHPQT